MKIRMLAFMVLFVSAAAFANQQELMADDADFYDRFGRSVAYGGSGDTVLIGAYLDDIGTAIDAGSAYIFRRGTDDSFSQDEHFVAPGFGAGDFFGAALALSDAGDVALIGAPGDDLPPALADDIGSAHVFMQAPDGSWAHQELVAPDGAQFDEFGTSVTLSGGATTAIIGAPKDDTPGGADAGSAHVFTRGTDGTWVHQAQLLAPDASAGDRFGGAVAVSRTGDLALVGASADDTLAGFDAGSAHVFTRAADGTWSHQAQLLAPDASAGDRFGAAVDLSDSYWDFSLVGAPYDDTAAGSDAGSVHVFRGFLDGSWSHNMQLQAPEEIVSEGFGSAVSTRGVPSNSTFFGPSSPVVIIGSPFDDTSGGSDAGSAYVFSANWTLSHWAFATRLLNPDGEAGDRFGRSVSFSPWRAEGERTALIGSDDADIDTINDAGIAWLFVAPNNDGDYQSDWGDIDDDNDGLYDAVETNTGIFVSGSDVGSDPLALDSDGDNWDDGNERGFYQTDPTDASSTLDPHSGKLIVLDGSSSDELGGAVSLSSAGDVALLVSAPDDWQLGTAQQGPARLFERDVEGTWNHVHSLSDPADTPGSKFGGAVALSAMAETALVGGAAIYGSQPGYAHVFRRVGDGSWSHEQQLIEPGASPSGAFGYSVALSGSGDVALVGDPIQNTSENPDSAHVFYRSMDGTWTHEAELLAPEGASAEWFGGFVTLSSDGGTALIGDPNATGAGTDSGAAYVFVRALDGTWSYQQELVPPASAEGRGFGFSGALSETGDTALVGEPGISTSDGFDGSAHVFIRNQEGTWSHAQRMSPPTPAGYVGSTTMRFGSSAALNSSGEIALLGARTWISSNPESPQSLISGGAAFLFLQAIDGTWIRQPELLAADRAHGDQLGSSVGLSSSGETAIAGAYLDSRAAGLDTGAAYVFDRDLLDTDGDGLPDAAETNTGIFVDASNTGTDPFEKDTDGDGLLDGAETNTLVFAGVSDTGSDPFMPDTDGDGFSDATEVAEGSDPVDSSSTPAVFDVPALKPLGLSLLAALAALLGGSRIHVSRRRKWDAG